MKRLVIRRERCKGCELCIKFCKKKVLGIATRINAGGYYPAEVVSLTECTGCRDCEIICPDRAITVVVQKPPTGNRNRKRKED